MGYNMQRLGTLDGIGLELGLEGTRGLIEALGFSDPLQLLNNIQLSYHEAYRRIVPEDQVPFDQYARDWVRKALRERGYEI